MDRLSGKFALVTGASSGIGRAAALALAAEGATVAVLARRGNLLRQVVDEIERLGGRALACQADIADPTEVLMAFELVKRQFGRLDILVQCAGINTGGRLMADTTPEEWRQVVDVNLNGTFYCARAALDIMRPQGGGLIINVSSGAARRASLMAGVAYAASKHGVAALTQHINLEDRKHNIRACEILPGEVDTPIMEQRPYPPSPAARATMLHPEDVAAAVVFVATLPERATVEELAVRPTVVRDWTEDMRRARRD